MYCHQCLALCEGNPPVTGGFPTQRASTAGGACPNFCGDKIIGFEVIEYKKMVKVGDELMELFSETNSWCHQVMCKHVMMTE